MWCERRTEVTSSSGSRGRWVKVKNVTKKTKNTGDEWNRSSLCTLFFNWNLKSFFILVTVPQCLPNFCLCDPFKMKKCLLFLSPHHGLSVDMSWEQSDISFSDCFIYSFKGFSEALKRREYLIFSEIMNIILWNRNRVLLYCKVSAIIQGVRLISFPCSYFQAKTVWNPTFCFLEICFRWEILYSEHFSWFRSCGCCIKWLASKIWHWWTTSSLA